MPRENLKVNEYFYNCHNGKKNVFNVEDALTSTLIIMKELAHLPRCPPVFWECFSPQLSLAPGAA